jgi:hypothetical protein
MKRIGIAASKISEGNIVLYNVFVLVLSTLFSLLIFFLSAFSVFVAIYVIHALMTGTTEFNFSSSWGGILRSCMTALALMTAFLNLCAISVNLKLKL